MLAPDLVLLRQHPPRYQGRHRVSEDFVSAQETTHKTRNKIARADIEVLDNNQCMHKI